MDTAREADRNVFLTECRTCGFWHSPTQCPEGCPRWQPTEGNDTE